MVFHNGLGYRPVNPRAPHLLGHPEQHESVIELDGLHYRSDVDASEHHQRLISGDGSLNDYQYWVDTGWKAEHGTTHAAKRLTNKLGEETQEFSEASFAHLNNPTDESAAEVVLEAGDVLWCAVAIASLTTARLDVILKDRLYEYNHGVALLSDGTPPIWQPIAGRLAVKREDLLISDIDGLLDVGFEPLITPRMNIEGDSDEYDVTEHLDMVTLGGQLIISACEDLYSLADDDPVFLLPEAVRRQGEAVGALVTALLLELAFGVRRLTGQTLQDTVIANVLKLTHRVTTGTVDKADGDRQE